MTIIQLFVVALILAFGFWANNKYLAGLVRTIVNIILIIAVLAVVLNVAGVGFNLNSRV